MDPAESPRPRPRPSDVSRAVVHVALATGLFAIYGVQVCPYLADLSTFDFMAPVLTVMAAVLIVRPWVHRLLAIRVPRRNRVAASMRVDIALFVAAGLATSTFNWVAYGLPPGSAAKVVAGFVLLGFFAATDLALHRELLQSRTLIARGEALELDERYVSYTRKFTVFAVISVAALAGVCVMVVDQDLLWLMREGASLPPKNARVAVIAEVSFVAVTVMGYVIAIILSHARNTRFFLEHQARALRQVQEGQLRPNAPVTTNDELGHIAQMTNATIESLAQRTLELEASQDVTITSLASLAETRDNETGAHIERTRRYVRVLAEALRDHPVHRDQLDREMIALLYKSAPLHDIGKVGIPDKILLKPDRLTPDEFEIMKTHAQLGADALRAAEERGGSASFLSLAREIAETHHERWDGSGYPRGLAGTDIPISGRLMAVADVYDALITRRVYKPAMPHEEAREIILSSRGSHFDPDIVDAFVACERQFVQIACEFADPPESALPRDHDVKPPPRPKTPRYPAARQPM